MYQYFFYNKPHSFEPIRVLKLYVMLTLREADLEVQVLMSFISDLLALGEASFGVNFCKVSYKQIRFLLLAQEIESGILIRGL